MKFIPKFLHTRTPVKTNAAIMLDVMNIEFKRQEESLETNLNPEFLKEAQETIDRINSKVRPVDYPWKMLESGATFGIISLQHSEFEGGDPRKDTPIFYEAVRAHNSALAVERRSKSKNVVPA